MTIRSTLFLPAAFSLAVAAIGSITLKESVNAHAAIQASTNPSSEHVQELKNIRNLNGVRSGSLALLSIGLSLTVGVRRPS